MLYLATADHRCYYRQSSIGTAFAFWLNVWKQTNNIVVIVVHPASDMSPKKVKSGVQSLLFIASCVAT